MRKSKHEDAIRKELIKLETDITHARPLLFDAEKNLEIKYAQVNLLMRLLKAGEEQHDEE